MWKNRGGGVHFVANAAKLLNLPGEPIAYWISSIIANILSIDKFDTYFEPKAGLSTGDNDQFLKLWFEVNLNDIYFTATDCIQAMYTGKKWFPYSKGGSFRKWYGNNEYIVNWQDNGKEIASFVGPDGKLRSTIRNRQYYFSEGGAWSSLASGPFSMRYVPKGFIFDSKGPMCFPKDESLVCYMVANLNSNVVNVLLNILSPTLDYSVGALAKIPTYISEQSKDAIETISKKNIAESKKEWDSFEESWNFKKHPLI